MLNSGQHHRSLVRCHDGRRQITSARAGRTPADQRSCHGIDHRCEGRVARSTDPSGIRRAIQSRSSDRTAVDPLRPLQPIGHEREHRPNRRTGDALGEDLLDQPGDPHSSRSDRGDCNVLLPAGKMVVDRAVRQVRCFAQRLQTHSVVSVSGENVGSDSFDSLTRCEGHCQVTTPPRWSSRASGRSAVANGNRFRSVLPVQHTRSIQDQPLHQLTAACAAEQSPMNSADSAAVSTA